MTTDAPDEQAARIAAGLGEAEREALLAMPIPRPANAFLGRAERRHSGLWRKMSGHWKEMTALEGGVVECRTSRGEILWRLTRPLGLRVRAIIAEQATDLPT